MEIPEQDSLYIFADFDKSRKGLINFEDFMDRILVINCFFEKSLSFQREI